MMPAFMCSSITAPRCTMLRTIDPLIPVSIAAIRGRRLRRGLPWVSAFPELNVRTYVHRDGVPGVWFLSLEASNPFAVAGARINTCKDAASPTSVVSKGCTGRVASAD